MAQAAVKIMAGEELGLPPIASMMGFNIIKGKIAMSGNLMGAQLRKHGYDYRMKRHDTTGCELEFLSKLESGKRTPLGLSSFTEEDAKQAGLLGSDTYKKYPRNMYFNRAMSNGCKWHTPEIFGGAPVYTPEELGANVDGEGNVIHVTPAPAGPSPGTQAAADAVGQAKVEQLQRASAPSQTAPALPSPPAAAQPTERIPEEVLAMWAELPKGFAETVAVFQAFHQEFDRLSGDDTEYRTILAKHGMKAGNDLKGHTRGTVKQAIWDLWNAARKLRAEPLVADAEAVDPRADWMPANLGGTPDAT